jgi:adenosylcobinamide-GDP ribazoletransferase
LNDDAGDAHPPRGPQGPDFGSRLRDDFVMGLRFYSRIPVPVLPHEAPELNRIALALPFTSLAIGIVPALLLVVLRLLGVPSLFAAGLAVLALILVTGAMAEDALADAADGLGGGSTATRRLEIMRDHAHGTYGICAIVLFLVLRVGAIASLAPLPAAGLWLASQLLSRSGALWLTVALPPARADGASAAVGGVTRGAFGVGAVFTIILGILLAFPWAGVLALIVALAGCAAVALGWTLLCQRLVGGQTGDLIGALQGLLEITALTAFLIFI